MPLLINLHSVKFNPQKHIKIDRTSIFGNPFKITPRASRERVIRSYEEYFYAKLVTEPQFEQAVLASIPRLQQGFALACWCVPPEVWFCRPNNPQKFCHGEVILDYLVKQGLRVELQDRPSY